MMVEVSSIEHSLPEFVARHVHQHLPAELRHIEPTGSALSRDARPVSSTEHHLDGAIGALALFGEPVAPLSKHAGHGIGGDAIGEAGADRGDAHALAGVDADPEGLAVAPALDE